MAQSARTLMGACTVGIALLQFTPQVIEYPHAKWIVYGLVAVALVCLVISYIFDKRDADTRNALERDMRCLLSDIRAGEIVREREAREQAQRFQALAAMIPKPQPIAITLEVEPISKETKEREKRLGLRDRVMQLGNDLFDFMREKGPDPEVTIDKSKSLEEQIRHVMDVRGPYVEGIHYGYMAHFRDRVVKMFNELAEAGIPRPDEIKGWELDPPQVQRADNVRKIAENLFLIAAKMDIADAAKGT